MRRKKLFVRLPKKGLLYSIVLCAVIIVVGGLGFWVLEPKVHNFADGLWLAFTTAATVGYGDIVPSTMASRAFSIEVVLMGLAVLSLVTASVAAILVEAEERDFDSTLLHQVAQLQLQLDRMEQQQRQLLKQQGDQKP